MAVQTADLAAFANKRVVIVRNLPEPDAEGNATVEIEGTVQAVNEMGVLIKPKGKVTFDLITTDEIEDVFEKAAEDKKVTVSKLKPVAREKVKRHLADRHGIAVDWLNSVSDEEAEAYHDGIDHEAAKLGHRHVEPSESDAGEATDDSDEE